MTQLQLDRRQGPVGQSGVALVVVLLFLLAITGAVLFGARSVLMSETMARNQLDLQLARQAAEAALRDAEQDLQMPGGYTPANAVCSRGLYRPVAQMLGLFTKNCQAGQCDPQLDAGRLQTDYANASATNQSVADPWWPVSRGGMWGNDFSGKPVLGNGTSNAGVCSTFTGGVPLGTYTGTAALKGVLHQPEYMLERVARGETVFFRVTARGFGVREGSEVVLQSYVLMPEL